MNLKLIYILLIIKGLIMSNLLNAAPYFGVDIDLHNVAVDIRVNDVPVYFDELRGQTTVEVPAPDSIFDGNNSLSVSTSFTKDFEGVVRSDFEPGAYVSAVLFRQDGKGSKQNLTSILIKLTTDGIDSIETENFITGTKSNPKLEISARGRVLVKEEVEIKSPFPRWVWQDGKTIENSDDNFNSLMAQYEKIHKALQNQDKKTIFDLYSARAKEVAVAYSLGGETEGHKKISTGMDMVDDKLKLFKLFTDNMRLDIVGNGKLARIVDNEFTQPILFTEPAARLFHFHKFMFYLNKDNQWVMIR